MTSEPRCLCGGEGELVVEPREITLSRWSTIVDDEFVRCKSCGLEWHLPGQMQATQERAARVIRNERGLFSPERIRALRKRYGLSQSQFERLLGVGPKTVVRWEKGSVVPNAATNRLLEVLETLPEAAGMLSLSHGVIIDRIVPHALQPPVSFSLLPQKANIYPPTAGEWECEKAVA